ncbi:hypothetical protein BT69DRAFT_294441 [Atractiella rhizophila]|nr:hypothetical protein BT69DRAFT_294441 [Atractiella rhizophila]
MSLHQPIRRRSRLSRYRSKPRCSFPTQFHQEKAKEYFKRFFYKLSAEDREQGDSPESKTELCMIMGCTKSFAWFHAVLSCSNRSFEVTLGGVSAEFKGYIKH